MGLNGDTHVARLFVDGDDGIGVHRAPEIFPGDGRGGDQDGQEQKQERDFFHGSYPHGN
jgi:hypothetical protein